MQSLFLCFKLWTTSASHIKNNSGISSPKKVKSFWHQTLKTKYKGKKLICLSDQLYDELENFRKRLKYWSKESKNIRIKQVYTIT